MGEIGPGVRVLITDASGIEHECEALSAPTKGHSMVVVWVNCPKNDGTYDPTPWPVENVRVAPNTDPKEDD